MRLRLLFPTITLVAAACGRETARPTPTQVLGVVEGDARSRVVVDSARREVVLYAGPFRVPVTDSMSGMHDMAGMADAPPTGSSGMADHGVHAFSPLVRFQWPLNGWYRGFRGWVVDAEGRELPRSLLHHLTGADFTHRQLLEADLIRFVGAGSETPEVIIPRFLGMPMNSGQELGIYAGWHNESGKEINGVYIRLEMLYVPSDALLKPISVFPVQMDVANTPGEPNAYALPPGRSSRALEFEMPIKGRFLGIGGHLHDFGVELRLEDAQSGKVLTRVTSQQDSTGHVLSVGRKYFPLLGLRMAAGHRYRVVGEYLSPQRDTVPNAAMAIVAGLFAPSDPTKWPAANFSNPQTQADLSSLPGGSHVSAPVIGAMARTEGTAGGAAQVPARPR